MSDEDVPDPELLDFLQAIWQAMAGGRVEDVNAARDVLMRHIRERQQTPLPHPSVLEGVLGPYSGSPLFYDPRLGMFYLNDRASSPEHYRILQNPQEADVSAGAPQGLGARQAINFPDIWREDDPFTLVRDTLSQGGVKEWGPTPLKGLK